MAPGITELDAIGITSLRMIALFMVAPFFGHAVVPVRIRMTLAFGVSLVIAPTVPVAAALGEAGPFALVSLVVGELAVGLSLGFAVRLIFAAFDVLAEAASIQGGLGAAQTIDPTSGSSSAALGAILGMTGLGVWMAIGGHHDLLRALVASYELLPVGGGGLGRESFLAIVGMAPPVFALGLQLAAPVTVAMMVSNSAVGMLGRVIPQLNLITLQLPAHVAMTLLLLSLGAHGLVTVFGGEMGAWTARALSALMGEG